MYLDFLFLVGRVQHDLHRLSTSLLVHCGARDFFQQVQSVLVLHHAQIGHFALLHDVVRVGLAEPSRL